METSGKSEKWIKTLIKNYLYSWKGDCVFLRLQKKMEPFKNQIFSLVWPIAGKRIVLQVILNQLFLQLMVEHISKENWVFLHKSTGACKNLAIENCEYYHLICLIFNNFILLFINSILLTFSAYYWKNMRH